MTTDITKLKTHEGITIHPERKTGRRAQDAREKSRREIDKFHRENGLFFLSEQTLMRKAIEALLSRDIAALQKAQQELTKKE